MIGEQRVETAPSDVVTIGTRVEVRNLALQTWSRGFQVAGLVGDGYLLRRLYDGFILPRCFSADVIRPC